MFHSSVFQTTTSGLNRSSLSTLVVQVQISSLANHSSRPETAQQAHIQTLDIFFIRPIEVGWPSSMEFYYLTLFPSLHGHRYPYILPTIDKLNGKVRTSIRPRKPKGHRDSDLNPGRRTHGPISSFFSLYLRSIDTLSSRQSSSCSCSSEMNCPPCGPIQGNGNQTTTFPTSERKQQDRLSYATSRLNAERTVHAVQNVVLWNTTTRTLPFPISQTRFTRHAVSHYRRRYRDSRTRRACRGPPTPAFFRDGTAKTTVCLVSLPWTVPYFAGSLGAGNIGEL